MLTVFFTGQLRHKKYIEQFVHDVLLEHFYIDDDEEIDIEIRSERVLENNTMGFCTGDDTTVTIELARGYYDGTEYCRHSFEEIIITLAHELVHAKQNINNEFQTETEREREAYKLEKTLREQYWLNTYPCT